jgi:phage shock protein A
MKNVINILQQSKNSLLNQLKVEQEDLVQAKDAVTSYEKSVSLIEQRIKEIEDAIKALGNSSSTTDDKSGTKSKKTKS